MTKITGGHLCFVCMCARAQREPSQRRRWRRFSLQRQARAQHRLKRSRNQRASGERHHTGVFRMRVRACLLCCRRGTRAIFTSYKPPTTASLGSRTLFVFLWNLWLCWKKPQTRAAPLWVFTFMPALPQQQRFTGVQVPGIVSSEGLQLLSACLPTRQDLTVVHLCPLSGKKLTDTNKVSELKLAVWSRHDPLTLLQIQQWIKTFNWIVFKTILWTNASVWGRCSIKKLK